MGLDLKYRLSIGALKLIALLPLSILYILSDLVYLIVYHLVGYRRKVVCANLKLAFSDKTSHEIQIIEKQFYHHFCDLIVESVKLLSISDKQMRKRFVVTNGELLNNDSRSSQVIMLGHYCNWEWVQALSLYFDPRGSVAGQVFKPLHNELMDRVMLKIRSRFNLENIPQQRAVRRLLEVQERGDRFVVGLISDQRPAGRDFRNWMNFLGVDTPYVTGGEKIGVRSNAEFLYASIAKPSRGHYTLTYEKLPAPLDGEYFEGYYTQLFMKKFEESIRRAPQYWLWTHKIWKRGKDGKPTNYYK